MIIDRNDQLVEEGLYIMHNEGVSCAFNIYLVKQ